MDDLDSNMPPPEATGDDRPSDNEDKLDDLSPEFTAPVPPPAADDDSDDESLLSEVDEAEFADFDPSAVQVAPDFDALKSIKVKKRQRVDGEEEAPKKKKEKTREKVKKNHRRRDSDDGFELGNQVEGKRRRKGEKSAGGEPAERRRPVREEPADEDLTPQQLAQRRLERQMELSLRKGHTKRVRKGDIDLESYADQEIEDMRNRMTRAAEEDGELLSRNLPASQKLKMLSEVVALLNRSNYTQGILDPETNLLEAVRFFLEPLTDGSLPAYNIQRELFGALARLPMTKEALISSGIGKVVLFYRKSKRSEPAIKRQATKLMEEWSRPLLGRSEDFQKKVFQTAVFDPDAKRGTSGIAMPVRKTSLEVGPGQKNQQRARILPGATSYKIAPVPMHR